MTRARPSVRLVVVGGGSTYTPELADGIARLGDALPVERLVLVDPHLERTRIVADMCARIFASAGVATTVEVTDDLEHAAADADAVLLQLRVGGQDARDRDETWPLDCGCIGQETTGAGGLAKALRTIPVVLDLADRLRRVNPDAWIVNFTNPVGMVTRALLDAGHRAVGLCNVAIGFERLFARELGVEPDRIQLQHAGLNHLSWELGVGLRVDEGAVVDVLDLLIDEHADAIVEETELPLGIIRDERTIPSYYLRYYYQHDELVERGRATPSRASAVAALERELLELYADPSVTTKPAALAGRGGAFYSEAAIGLLASLLGTGEPADHVVNVRNRGILPFLPDDAVIEARAHVSRDEIVVHPLPEVPPLAAGLIAHVSRYEELGVEAALHGGVTRIQRALLAHPLVGQYPLARDMAERLLAENREWLDVSD